MTLVENFTGTEDVFHMKLSHFKNALGRLSDGAHMGSHVQQVFWVGRNILLPLQRQQVSV